MLNVFRMFGKMGGQRLRVTGDGSVGTETMRQKGVREQPDVWALASLRSEKAGILCVLAWNYHDDDVPGPTAITELALAGLPDGKTSLRLTHYRIDDRHSNAFTVWKDQGSPQAPTGEQIAQMQQAAQLTSLEAPQTMQAENGAANVRFALPRQAVSLLMFEW